MRSSLNGELCVGRGNAGINSWHEPRSPLQEPGKCPCIHLNYRRSLTGCANGAVINPIAPAEPEPVYVTAPLTGVLYEDTTPEALQLKKPSVACKIDNGSEAPRPQTGLNNTDIVFDEMVEGGLTRLVAIWHSKQPEEIGPVRSN